MHPNQVELFTIINKDNINDLKDFLNTEPQACWLLNEDNLSALDYSLKFDRHASVNTILEKLSYDANISPARSTESQMAFHYALAKAVKHYCSGLKSWTKFLELYQTPEARFTFLTETKKGWYELGVGALQQGVPYTAFNELVYTKPKIQRYIRANAIATAMINFFNQNGSKSPFNTLKSLSTALTDWFGQKVFSDHSVWGMSWLKETDTVTSLRELKDACDYLITNAGQIPADCPLDMAKKIILLCTKCYPFSLRSIQEYWLKLAHGLIEAHQNNYDDVKALYLSLMDKQWLSSGDNIPFVEHHLMKKMDRHDLALYLDGHELEDLASLVDQKKVLVLKPNHTLDLLNFYPMPNAQKNVLITQALDTPMKEFLHGLLMNNPTLSISYANTEVFQVNPLKLFSHAPCQVFLDIKDQSQLAHITAYIKMQSYTQHKMGLALPKALLESQKTLPALDAIQQDLGLNQTVTILILSNLEERLVLADMVISKHSIDIGPQIRDKSAAEPTVFYDLYQKLNWNHCMDTNPVDVQIKAIELARNHHRPLMFVFYQDFDLELLVRTRELLKNDWEHRQCLIRFGSEKTCDSDFLVTSRGINPGPLSQAKLCTNPNRRLSNASSSSTASMVRATAPIPVQEPVDKLTQDDPSHDDNSNRSKVTN